MTPRNSSIESPSLSCASLQEALQRIRGEIKRSKNFLTFRSPDGTLKSLRYGTMHDRIDRLGSLFATWEMKPQDRVLLASHDDGALLTSVLACLYHGYSAVVVDPESSPVEAEHVLELTRFEAAILDTELREKWPLDKVSRILPISHAGVEKGRLFQKLLGRRDASDTDRTSYPGVLDNLEPLLPPESLPDDDEAYVLFTSGSTSKPKGVRISRGALFNHSRTFSRHFGYGPDSRLLCLLPLHHTDGLFHGSLTPWLCGGESLRPMRFSVGEIQEFFDSIYTLRATHFVTVPTMLNLLDRFGGGYEDTFETEDFRFIVSSASPLDESLWARFQERFGVKVTNLYGLTETVCGGLYCGPDAESFRLGTIGNPVDCRVRIVDEQGRELGPEAPGELLIGGSLLTMGYVNDDEATKRAIRAGWFYTWDTATVDSDGFYRIIGRKKNLVVTGGINVQPEEVTSVLLQFPGIREAVAFGVEDETFGEVLASCAVLEEGTSLTPEEIIAHCREHLAPHKVPRTASLVPALPRTPSGKISLTLVRELHQKAIETAHPSALRNSDLQVLDLASKTFRIPRGELDPGMGPREIPEWDSFAHLSFVVELESHFALKFTPAEIMAIKTLRDAQNLIQVKTSG